MSKDLVPSLFGKGYKSKLIAVKKNLDVIDSAHERVVTIAEDRWKAMITVYGEFVQSVNKINSACKDHGTLFYIDIPPVEDPRHMDMAFVSTMIRIVVRENEDNVMAMLKYIRELEATITDVEERAAVVALSVRPLPHVSALTETITNRDATISELQSLVDASSLLHDRDPPYLRQTIDRSGPSSGSPQDSINHDIHGSRQVNLPPIPEINIVPPSGP